MAWQFSRLDIRPFRCSQAELFLVPHAHLLCQWNLGQYQQWSVLASCHLFSHLWTAECTQCLLCFNSLMLRDPSCCCVHGLDFNMFVLSLAFCWKWTDFESTFKWRTPLFPFQSISFSGGNRRYVQTSIPNGQGLTVFGSYVFWIDQNTKNVSYFDHLMKCGFV